VVPLRVGVLGPVTTWRDGHEVSAGQPRQLAVLGVLATRANRVVSRDELVDAVWGDDPPASAEGGVYTYVAGLRRILEPDRPLRSAGRGEHGKRTPAQVLVSAGGGYMLRLAPGALDAEVFEEYLARARALRASSDAAAALSAVDEALGLWRGTAFAGVPGPFAEAERQRLDELHTGAAEERADLMLALGRSAEVIPELTTLTAEHPLRERARGLLMIALYRCGRQAEALQVFYDIREQLGQDLGIDPGGELNQVHQQVLAMDPALGGPEGVPPGQEHPGRDQPGRERGGRGISAARVPAGQETPARVPAQVPPDTAGFAGRTAELRLLHGILPGDHVTLSPDPEMLQAGHAGLPVSQPSGACSPVAVVAGTAGVGKTTLGIRFARQAATYFPDGQLYVNLRGFDQSGEPLHPGSALRGFFDALGVPPQQVPSETEAKTALFRSLLNGKRMLLLLDNARSTEQVRPLLPGSPGCMVIVTSRSQLTGLVAAEGARLLSLDVMSGTEARELLAGRLGEGRVAAEPAAAGELILRSAGLPLALSVTCARAVSRPGLALADLASELRDARGRLDVLQTDDAATDLRAVFSWSYDRLSESAARMFRLLGTHPGPDVSAAAAASLAGVPAGQARVILAELTRASLLTEGPPGRFTFHDLLRVYAAECAASTPAGDERDQARLRLVDHYVRTASVGSRRVYPGRHRMELPPAPEGVEPEEFGSYEEVLDWFGAEHHVLRAIVALAAERGLDTYCWKLAWVWAPLLKRRGMLHEDVAVQRIALTAARRLADPVSLGHVHYELGHVYSRLGKLTYADAHLSRALEMFTGLGDRVNIGQAEHGIALLLNLQGRWREALPHATEALRLRRSFGDRAMVAYSENAVGWIYANLGNYTEGLRHCRRALELHRESGSRSGAADTLDSIALAYSGLGDYERAMAHYQQALLAYRGIGDPEGEASALTHLGDAQLIAGLPVAARHSWERALDLFALLPGDEAHAVRDRLTRLKAQEAASA
jgi:DNA-binding SARP family transcriptional activator/tetratricopeptide (TPR) repeat protein